MSRRGSLGVTKWHMLTLRLQVTPRRCRNRTGNTLNAGKVIPVTGRGSQCCGTLRLPHSLNNRLTDGGEVSFNRWPPFVPKKIPGTVFC
jgi:hypothetical protein